MKKAIIIIVAILVIALGGYLMFSQNDTSDMKKLAKNMTEQKGLISWLTGGKGAECSVGSPEGEIVVKAKNGKVRIEGMGLVVSSSGNQSDKGVYLNDGEWIYMWNGNEGTKMNIESMKELSGEEDEDDYSWQDWAEDWQENKVNYNCKEKNLSSDLFEPPKDVKFEDLTKFNEQMQELSNKIIEDVNLEETLDMDEVMKQFENMNQEDIEKKLEEMGVDPINPNASLE